LTIQHRLASGEGACVNNSEWHADAIRRAHRPIPHYGIVQALIETLVFRHIGVVHDEYAVSPVGMKASFKSAWRQGSEKDRVPCPMPIYGYQLRVIAD